MTTLEGVDIKIRKTDVPAYDLVHKFVDKATINKFQLGNVDNVAMILDSEWATKALITGNNKN